MEGKNDLIWTLGYWLRNNGKEILLGMKKVRWGKGRWNGPGGEVKQGEDIYSAFARETDEESGLIFKKAEKRGFLGFYFIGDPIFRYCHIFMILDCEGEPKDSDEMHWRWFPVSSLPFEQMWPADKYWMPLLLADKKFIGKFFYRDTDLLLGYELKEVENFDE